MLGRKWVDGWWRPHSVSHEHIQDRDITVVSKTRGSSKIRAVLHTTNAPNGSRCSVRLNDLRIMAIAEMQRPPYRVT